MGEFCTYDRFREISRELRGAGRRTVLVGGHFDLFHVGHAAFLAESRRRGEALLVYVPNDKSSCNLKGLGRPVLPAFERAYLLAALASTDYVTIVPYEMTADNVLAIDQRLIRELSPAVYVCVDGVAFSARLSILRKTTPETEVVGIPPQSLVWSSTRIARALGNRPTADDMEGTEPLPPRTSNDPTHRVFMADAWRAAESSHCPILQVGAAIVTDGDVFATGTNAPPDAVSCWCPAMSQPLTWSRPPCAAIHAETRAILATMNARAAFDRSTLYVTHAPCFHCAKLIVYAGIRNVVYEHEYASSAGRTLLQMAGINVTRFIPT